jgi:gliding motility-associated-like protein
VNIPVKRICSNPPIEITIIDTIHIKTDTVHCNLAVDPTRINIPFAECGTGATAGTSNHGTWDIDISGCFTYHGGPLKGTDTIFVCVCDTTVSPQVCDQTTIIITLIGYPPVAVDDSTHTNMNVPVVIHVLQNDTTYDEDPLTLCSPDAIVIQPIHGTVIPNSDGTVTYTPANDYVGRDSFQYQICDPEGRDTAWVFITIDTLDTDCEIPNAFSPNSDGINDVFVIPCAVGDVEFSVYNRWGIEVYRNDKYLNDWDGKYKGAELPDGTYYYVVKYMAPTGEVNKAGFITLHR